MSTPAVAPPFQLGTTLQPGYYAMDNSGLPYVGPYASAAACKTAAAAFGVQGRFFSVYLPVAVAWSGFLTDSSVNTRGITVTTDALDIGHETTI